MKAAAKPSSIIQNSDNKRQYQLIKSEESTSFQPTPRKTGTTCGSQRITLQR